jgi:hypothetical protein
MCNLRFPCLFEIQRVGILVATTMAIFALLVAVAATSIDIIGAVATSTVKACYDGETLSGIHHSVCCLLDLTTVSRTIVIL